MICGAQPSGSLVLKKHSEILCDVQLHSWSASQWIGTDWVVRARMEVVLRWAGDFRQG